jgi:hypothetical protein
VGAHTYLIRSCETQFYKYRMEPRTVRKEQAYSPKEFAIIQEAAEWAGLNPSEWLRYVGLLQAKQTLAAKRFANRLHEREQHHAANNLFETTLMATKHRGFKPLQDSEQVEDEQVPELDVDAITKIIEAFAQSLSTVHDWADLSDTWNRFCLENEIPEQSVEIFTETMVEAARQTTGGETDQHVKSFLRQIQKPFPAPTTTTPNREGMSPRPGETSTKDFLKQLKVAAHSDPFGNDYRGGVKAFDRDANRYGRNYSYKTDFNNQRPTWPLANSDLNVNTGRTDEAFAAIDAVGLGALTHYRVVNRLTGEYVTKQMHREDAQQVAVELNAAFAQEVELHESVSRKHFQQVANTVRAIENPKKRQEFADHHAALFSQRNPRFDHARFHAACGTQCPSGGKLRNEGNQLPSTPITEGLHNRDDAKMARYVDAINKSMTYQQDFTMDGGKYQSTDTSITALADFRATALLQERNKTKFAGKAMTEQDAVRSQQSKANPRPNQARIERLENGVSSDADFLNGINTRSLIKE